VTRSPRVEPPRKPRKNEFSIVNGAIAIARHGNSRITRSFANGGVTFTLVPLSRLLLRFDV